MCSNTAVLMKERLWALLARHEVDRQGQASSPEQRKRVTRVDLDLACAGWRHGIKGTPAARHKHTTLTAPVQEHAEGYGTCSSCIGQGLLCAAVVCGVPLRRTKCTARQRRLTKPLLSCGGIYHRVCAGPRGGCAQSTFRAQLHHQQHSLGCWERGAITPGAGQRSLCVGSRAGGNCNTSIAQHIEVRTALSTVYTERSFETLIK